MPEKKEVPNEDFIKDVIILLKEALSSGKRIIIDTENGMLKKIEVLADDIMIIESQEDGLRQLREMGYEVIPKLKIVD